MNFSFLQDKSIEEQLSMGIRFFDLRIAHKPNDSSSDLYFTHVIYTHLTVMVSEISFRFVSLGFLLYIYSKCPSFLFRKRCCLLPPGWSLTRRRSSSSLAAISRELKTVSIKPSFSSWRSCSAQNSAHRVLVCSSHSCFTVWKQHGA